MFRCRFGLKQSDLKVGDRVVSVHRHDPNASDGTPDVLIGDFSNFIDAYAAIEEDVKLLSSDGECEYEYSMSVWRVDCVDENHASMSGLSKAEAKEIPGFEEVIYN